MGAAVVNTDFSEGADAASSITDSPMSAFQISAIGLCVVINALDGFDTLVAAYTASSIAKDWGLLPTQLGALFSAGLIGMALGAVFVAPLGDRVGRRPLILGCQLLIVLSMLASAFTDSILTLSATRVFTGLGIGGLLASINIMVAEYSSKRRRALRIGLMSLGYPIGAALGGLISIELLHHFGWRSVYVFGALSMAVVLPFTFIMLPESLSFLMLKPGPENLARINALLKKMGKPPLVTAPNMQTVHLQPPGLVNLLRGDYARSTFLMGLVYMAIMFAVYFVLNWLPKILTGMGYSDAGGISASLVMNVAGAISCLLMGVLANKFGLRRLAALIFIGLFASMTWFGFSPTTEVVLLSSVAVMGFFLFSTIAVSYAIVPAIFPAEIRLTAMGACLAFGRLGGVLGPYVAGMLISYGWDRSSYFLAIGAPILLAVVGLYAVKTSNVGAVASGVKLRPGLAAD